MLKKTEKRKKTAVACERLISAELMEGIFHARGACSSGELRINRGPFFSCYWGGLSPEICSRTSAIHLGARYHSPQVGDYITADTNRAIGAIYVELLRQVLRLVHYPFLYLRPFYPIGSMYPAPRKEISISISRALLRVIGPSARALWFGKLHKSWSLRHG